MNWRTSSYSGNSGGNCVETGARLDAIAVRDSKDRSGGILAYSRVEWAAFISSLKSGAFDLPG